MNEQGNSPLAVVLGLALLAALGGLAFVSYSSRGSDGQSAAELQAQLASSSARVAELEAALASTTSAYDDLAEEVGAKAAENQALSDQTQNAARQNSYLQKIVSLDPELLAKYSKTYFLNENYVPQHLATLDTKYTADPSKSIQIHTDVRRFLTRMIDAAADDGIALKVVSGYRSFGTQKDLKATYLTTFGTGANAFSADQGYSEHQLGTTVDITTGGGLDLSFAKDAGYAWLTKNAYLYGFELSYPAGNAFYQYEPWHWRFVGTDLASKLHRDGLNFYDLKQRDIDAYLAGIFG